MVALSFYKQNSIIVLFSEGSSRSYLCLFELPEDPQEGVHDIFDFALKQRSFDFVPSILAVSVRGLSSVFGSTRMMFLDLEDDQENQEEENQEDAPEKENNENQEEGNENESE